MSSLIACSISILALFGWGIDEPENPASQIGCEAIVGALMPSAVEAEPLESAAWLDAVAAKVVAAAGQVLDF